MPHRLVVYGYPPGADRDLSVMSAIPRLCRVLGDRYRIDLELWVARGATEYPAYHAILMRFLDERRSAGSSVDLMWVHHLARLANHPTQAMVDFIREGNYPLTAEAESAIMVA